MWSTLVFSAILVVTSLGLLAWHLHAFRTTDHGGLPERDQQFFRVQFRRRTISSGMIGLLGLAMIAALWIDDTIQQMLFWSGTMLVLCWLVFMALMDLWATKAHFGRDVAVQKAEYALIQAQIRKYREEQQDDPTQNNLNR